MKTSLYPFVTLVFISLFASNLSKAQSVQESLTKADRLYYAKNYNEALQLYLKYQGDLTPTQQVNVAVCYYSNPSKTAENYSEGMKWLVKSADRGNTEAMNTIAYCYSIGLGVKKDTVQQFQWVQKSASYGDAVSLANLAYYYKVGWSVPKDKEKARELYIKAVDKGNVDAAFYLGLFELENNNVTAAYHYIEKAARKKFIPAQFQLGKMHQEGTGTNVKDPDEAFRWYYKIEYSSNYSDYYRAAAEQMRVLGRVEPSTDLKKVKPLLLKLLDRANQRYYDVMGKEIDPYNKSQFEFGKSTTYYASLIDLGFKNAYIKKHNYNQQQKGGVIKNVDKFSYYADIVHSTPKADAQRIYNQWVGILKTVFSDWNIKEDSAPDGGWGEMTLTKNIKGLNFVMTLKNIVPSSGKQRTSLELEYYGDL